MVKLEFFGHSFFRITGGKNCLLVDPFLPTNSKRNYLLTSPKQAKDFKDVDSIFISHEHAEHFDKQAVEAIALRNNSIVVSHETVLNQLDIPINLKKSVESNQEFILRNVKVKTITAHHPRTFSSMGFMFDFNGKTVYHAGDTDLTDIFTQIKPDVALLPIGGQITMDVIDAVRATKTMKPKFVIPMHYNTFEEIKQNPLELKERIDKSILNTKTIILEPGQKFEF
ncbi:MAG: metal-dependent hydrolase [archaeon]